MVNKSEFTKEQLSELAFTPEELAQLDHARRQPIVFDEDCPEVTPERAVRFRRVNPPRNSSYHA